MNGKHRKIMTDSPDMRFDCDARDDIAIPDKCRILIVEDEILIAEDIRKSLARLGYCVTEMVTSGKKALDSIQAAPPTWCSWISLLKAR